MFLSKDEIVRLTGKKTRHTQKQVLDAMGITWKENGIGELVVSRKHVERVLGGEPGEIYHQGQEAMPNFAAIGG
ncbi:DUF4224 domain-containing protein [uncultured Marinobacter sp.]|uniref:DUF4224 domain-containing protein n=1 Tax=uncultured Marinobacter sp. TaxID=187379 RepID=UPI002584EE63|nr:DUF4224 domain-containing protein [uncultured Marinobacter sp.]